MKLENISRRIIEFGEDFAAPQNHILFLSIQFIPMFDHLCCDLRSSVVT
jgi:hypothetical protein